MFLPPFFLALFILLTPISIPAENYGHLFLRVESLEHKKLLLNLPIRAGDLFYFQYIHSSDKTPIRDTFKVDEEGQLILIEEAFRWYGAGLEFQDHRGVKVKSNGQWTSVHLNRLLLNLPVRVGRVSQQNLILDNQCYRLDQLARPGECLIFSIAR